MFFSLKKHNSVLSYRFKVASGILFAILLCFSLESCGPRVRKRPVGFMRLGNVLDLRSPDIVFKEKNLLLRHDDNGFYVMSLQCTFDSSPLVMWNVDSKRVFISPTSKSVYDENGAVLRGPAQSPLPYYRLKYSADANGSEFVVAMIGIEVPGNWRLPLEKSFVIYKEE